MRFKPFNFVRKLFLMLLKTTTAPALENLSLRKELFTLQFHDMDRFVKLRAVSKLSTLSAFCIFVNFFS
jgi:hypothetical protein